MPQIPLPYTNPEQDGRRKLVPEQYEYVKTLYKELNSLQKTADHFNVSKRTILLIVNPEAKRTIEQYRKNTKPWLKHYNKKKHTEAVRRYRQKKRKLGLIKKSA